MIVWLHLGSKPQRKEESIVRIMKTAFAVVLFLTVGDEAALAQEVPVELKTPNYRTRAVSGISHQPDSERQDPSNVIKVDDLYYVWYTQRKVGVHPYASTVFYASSKDGLHWTEHGQAVGKGEPGAWDSFGVITPYVAAIDGKYYLFYTGTSAAKPHS